MFNPPGGGPGQTLSPAPPLLTIKVVSSLELVTPLSSLLPKELSLGCWGCSMPALSRHWGAVV